jgi:hypothetical protein
MKPTFIGIGAQKCASSWLYDILADHPETALSSTKELDFFSYHYESGYAWYEQLFADKQGVKAIGEISPSYFHEASVPERVKLYNPSMRILVSLREPAERALSQHRHSVRIGVIPGPDYSFESGLADNPSYIDQGRYATHLAHWLAHFPDNQIYVVLMDDIKKDPEETARKVYEFLGISANHQSSALYEKSNPSYVVRSKAMDSTIRYIRKSVRNIGLGSLWQALGNSGLRKIYRQINRTKSEAVIPPVAPDTIKNLRQLYAEEISKLEKIINRNLDCWRK